MARRTPRRTRIALGLLAFVLVAVVSAAAATQHPYVRARVHQLVSEAIRREMGMEADLGPVYFSLPLGITADYIRLTHPKHGMFASAEKLEVQPSLTSLFRGRLEIARILIEGAQVRLRVSEGRVVNLPEFAARATSKDPHAKKPPSVSRIGSCQTILSVEDPPCRSRSIFRVAASCRPAPPR